MLKFWICGDNRINVRNMLSIIEKALKSANLAINTDVFNDPIEMLDELMKEDREPEVIISSLNMSPINGCELMKRLRELMVNSLVILIISQNTNEESLIKVMELRPFKLIYYEKIESDLSEALYETLRYIESSDYKKDFLDDVNVKQNVRVNDIKYVCSIDKKTIIVKSDERFCYSRLSVKEIYKRLCDKGFVYIRKGFVINSNCVIQCNKYSVLMSDGSIEEVSKDMYEEVMEKLVFFWKYPYKESETFVGHNLLIRTLL